ncbi:MAG: hypothetical protein GDA48_24780 [Hormoscilla sp. GM102CHS1]|nr:hypothetical protein [Hormoscilla sp. GM102CHS1]
MPRETPTVMSSGETPEAARIALDEAVNLFIAAATDMGTLEEILQETGYRLQNGKWVSPEWVAVEKHRAIIGV